MVAGEVKNFAYIYTVEQYLEEWNNDNHFSLRNNIEKFDTRQKLTQLHPPSSKDQVFKWVFQIPDLQIEQN